MAALHSALRALGPCKFQDIPSSPADLESHLEELFHNSQLILESIPIPPPDEKSETRPRSNTTSSSASNASEISVSSARSAPPIPEYAALQKEWGKSVKLSAKENPLGMAVYKMAGKDSRGAWFARRSVHEGLGFAKFKKSLEMEFPESLAVQGAPGEGNVRGIGGDRRVEDIRVPGKGRVEVFQLSAQFPGPTTPRDFVTLLVTSSNAMKQSDGSGRRDLSPRHYMIISKPCDHPDAQPRDGYVRGNYESVEFIREVPRRPKKTMSSLDLSKLGAKEAILRGAEKKKAGGLGANHESRSTEDVSSPTRAQEEGSRRRGKTISFSESKADNSRAAAAAAADDEDGDDGYDPELNPVEWIMVTRSDPGGSVPRFMVERGTPGSIVADASKFLNWACQKDDVEEDSKGDPPHERRHRDSFPSYEANGHLAGLNEDTPTETATPDETVPPNAAPSSSRPASTKQSGVLSGMTGALSASFEAYAPQALIDRIPGNSPQGSQDIAADGTSIAPSAEVDQDSDTDSLSTTSFASADSHLDQASDSEREEEEEEGIDAADPSSQSSSPPSEVVKAKAKAKDQSGKNLTPHEKELQKLQARRAGLDAKLASARDKSQKDQQTQTAKEKEAVRKA